MFQNPNAWCVLLAKITNGDREDKTCIHQIVGKIGSWDTIQVSNNKSSLWPQIFLLFLFLYLSPLLAICQTMASNISLPSFQGPLLKSKFLGRTDLSNLAPKSSFTTPRRPSTRYLRPYAKFNLSEILGGRGLLNGERGVEKELTRKVEEQTPAAAADETKEGEKSESSEITGIDSDQEAAFDKELMGLTGGFPGGEKGLRKFIEKNPPPKKPSVADSGTKAALVSSKKPKAPELPLLLPGMIAIVSNPNNPYHMYCGIVQRITDGKAGVLFEGGNWDRLITFRLEELTRREKGPPGKNPRSAVLEPLLQRDSE